MTKHYEQRKAANERYLSTLDKIALRMPKESGLKGTIQAHAEACGESVNAFILRAITEAMERDSGRLRRPRSYTLTENWAEMKYD